MAKWIYLMKWKFLRNGATKNMCNSDREKAPLVWTCGTLLWCCQDSLWHYMEAADKRGIAESGSSQLSTLMIDIPGDLVWDLPCVQQASYLEGAHWCGCWPSTCTLIKKSDYDMIYVIAGVFSSPEHKLRVSYCHHPMSVVRRSSSTISLLTL